MNYFRLIFGLGFFLSVIFGWWLPALILGVIGTWFFSWYIEIIVAGIVYDSLFGHLGELGIWSYAGAISSIIIFFVVRLSHNYVRK